MSSFAGREDFFAATKRRFAEVQLPNSMTARIRSLTEGEYAACDFKNYDSKKGGLSAEGLRKSDLRLMVACICDETGNPLFTDADFEKLQGIDAAVTRTLIRAIREHCGLQKDTEEALKNSETTGGGDSPTSS